MHQKLSAGRVQSSALKVLIDQERDIGKHLEKKYYKTSGIFNKNIHSSLNTNFESSDDTHTFLNDCKNAIYTIKSIDKKNSERKPPPPYTTSSIQQDIGSRF